jgi:hypothetical protein
MNISDGKKKLLFRILRAITLIVVQGAVAKLVYWTWDILEHGRRTRS